MAAAVKYRVNLLSSFSDAFGDKPIELRSKLRVHLRNSEVKNAIGEAIIDRIIERTAIKRIDKNNRRLDLTGPYSKRYQESLEFKVYRKDKRKIDLTLTGEMLSSMKPVDSSAFTLEIRMSDKKNNDKAHGNIHGTYGKKRGIAKHRRDFLGLPDKEVTKIVKEIISDYARDGELVAINETATNLSTYFVSELARQMEVV